MAAWVLQWQNWVIVIDNGCFTAHEMLPQWLSGKDSTCSAGDAGSVPGSGRSPGEGNGNPLQYSCLGNPMDRGAWRAVVHSPQGHKRVWHNLVTKQQPMKPKTFCIFLPFDPLYPYLPPLNPYHWRPPICSLYLWAVFCFYFFGFYIWVIIQLLSFSVWLISFSIMFSKFIHVAVNCNISLFYGWVIFHCVCVCVYT